jgi:cob(I)alamin adenosyltransferase
MRLDRIYTRSGDDGRTSLGDGARLPKFHVRVAAYGSVDEANSIVGIAMLHVSDVDIRNVLTHVQNDLFDLGGDLCRPEREHRKVEPLRVTNARLSGSRSGTTRSTPLWHPSTALFCRAAATRRLICITRARSRGAPSAT